MGISSEAFVKGDVYIEFPYEEVFFRFEKASGKVCRKFYGDNLETEVPVNSNLYAEACIAGTEIRREDYDRGRVRGMRP